MSNQYVQDRNVNIGLNKDKHIPLTTKDNVALDRNLNILEQFKNLELMI